MRFNFIFLSLTLVSCAAYERNQYEDQSRIASQRFKIETLIKDGHSEEASKELEGVELDSFNRNKLLEKISHQGTIETMGYSAKHKPVCEEKITKQVLVGDIQPTSSAIFNFVVAPCPELAKQIIDRADKKNLAEGANKIIQFVQDVIADQHKIASEELDEGKKNDLKTLGEVAPVLTLLKQKLASVCPKECTEVESLGIAVNNISALTGERKFYASKEGKNALAQDSVCSNYREDRRLRALIQDEKSKSKLSGYENVYKLKTWGDELHDVDVQLNEALVNYLNVTKKEFGKFSTCGE